MAKTEVNGPQAHPVWQLAKKAYPGEVKWNFDGIFLFDKEGKPVSRFSAQQLPKVEAALKALISDKEL